MEHQQNEVSPPKLTEVLRTVAGSVNLSAVGDTGAISLFEASTNLVNWGWLGVRSNVTGTFQFSDLLGDELYQPPFYRVSAP